MTRAFLMASVALLTVACAEPQTPLVQPDYRPVTDIHETMEWILDPAADKIWDSAGTIITAQGRTELAPTTAAGWLEVVQAAAVLAEAGNLLMLPGRSAGEDWNEYAVGLIAAGELAMDAARAEDDEALFDAGGRIYQVCKACHDQYWVAEDKPQ